jgi:hypothetical protein
MFSVVAMLDVIFMKRSDTTTCHDRYFGYRTVKTELGKMRPMPQGVRSDIERLSRLTRSDARKEGARA